MKLRELQAAAIELSGERGIPKEEVLGVVATALAAAYKKEYGDKEEKVEGIFDEKTDTFHLYGKKLVVNERILKNPEEAKEISIQNVTNLDKDLPITLEKRKHEEEESEFLEYGRDEDGEDKMEGIVRFKPQRHILLKEVEKLLPDAEVGDWVLFPLILKEDFGRIAAQTAKQVITQRLRELERNLAFASVKEKEGQMISGIIQRAEKGLIFVDLGKVTGTLAPPDQILGERYPMGQRIKVLVSRVEFGPRGPMVFLSRASGETLARMFAQEVPEIASGVIEIKTVAREAGARSKIAVHSKDSDIDPVGSCVGQKGTRISVIINEFNGEKIDIIPWSGKQSMFIANALAPAKVLSVELTDEGNRQAIAYVHPEQQSLAIGKKGQNVRLAVKLTGWKIDVRIPEEMIQEGKTDEGALEVKAEEELTIPVAEEPTKPVKKPRARKKEGAASDEVKNSK